MRSIFLFPTGDALGSVAVLNRLSPGQGDPWVVDGLMYVNVVTDEAELYADWDQETVSGLSSVVGRRPSWGIVIDVSGRIADAEKVRRVVSTLLEMGGFAIDDYGDDLWSAVEISAGTIKAGRLFFASGD